MSSDRQPATCVGAWMRGVGAVMLAGILCTSPACAFQAKAKQKATTGADTKDATKKSKPEKTAYDYVLPGADGKDVPLTNFKGKYILIVNLARKSSYNAQLAALEKDYETYKDKGLVVIGVPSNDFGAAEPGKDPEIQKAYADAKVTFPVMAVSKLAGDDVIPFYLYLTKSKDAPAGGPVHWNYTKFFVNKEGKVIARLGQDVTPDSPEMISTIEQILDGRYKPKKGGKEGPPSDGGGDDDDE
ncbi:glutathione peroxidase [Granulicella aggregans]|uniref:glutathione peroxidase n=1 Tax=Granulicella aggregans TaxID=474949 RepID=UPI0021DFD02C|nr:glutathione peroxidase [Granulicella aggregans]